jgi:hypothetical protein
MKGRFSFAAKGLGRGASADKQADTLDARAKTALF